MYITLTFILALLVVTFFWFQLRTTWKTPQTAFLPKWRIILSQEVAFYNSLNEHEKKWFEYKVHEFILNYKITGIETKIKILDKLLIASSAIIPIFKFEDWRYKNLKEILVYPDTFDTDYNTTGKGRKILGMVGTGVMSDKMILSRKALRNGFDNAKDKRNTAIHEFIHLIDMMDGEIDGIPQLLLEQPYVLPWLELMNQKMDDIYEENSDINPYGGTHRIEFFAVASEYFFERPNLLEKRHPKLYLMLEEIFDHDMSERDLKQLKEVGRNDQCPCGSGEKYKHCCMN